MHFCIRRGSCLVFMAHLWKSGQSLGSEPQGRKDASFLYEWETSSCADLLLS